MLNQAKTLYQLKKIQSALAKEVIEVETGNGAVRVAMTGEQKVKKITLNPELIDTSDIAKLEKWIESAVTQAVTRSQQVAAEKMKSVAGGLGIPGL
jgi:nucleoid-associated protein EbfC